MDWSLVLASQEIPTTIDHSLENRWALIVEPHDYGRAVRTIRQYHLENRGWTWRQHLPWSDVTFHWGGVVWSALLAVIYRISVVEFPSIHDLARVDNLAVLNGQWWRLFTAVLLHADLAHLIANMTTGALFFGLAMARFGAGTALLAAYLAGVAGNVAGLLIYHGPYQGLGASGTVMGALGLISAQTISKLRAGAFEKKLGFQAAFSGAMLFVLLGMDPSTDVIAHFGGFVSGIALACVLMWAPPQLLQSKPVQFASWFVLATLLSLTTVLSLWPHR
jgi:rhomboid protease GluP